MEAYRLISTSEFLTIMVLFIYTVLIGCESEG